MTSGDESVITCVVQCKTSQEKLLGKSDIAQAEQSINAFQKSGLKCSTYLLIINGDGRSADYNAAVEARLKNLVASGVAQKAELWARTKLFEVAFDRMKEILLHGLRGRAKERQQAYQELFRFGHVYLPEVPAQEDHLILKPGAPCERRSIRPLETRRIATLLQDRSDTRWTLLTGLFGAGKTTAALQASSVGEYTAIFVSASELGEGASRISTNALAQEIVGALRIFEHASSPIDGFYVSEPEDEEIFQRLAGAALSSLLRSETPEHVLVLDGLDENRVYLNSNGLQMLNNQLADFKCPIVLTTRFEHLSSMFGNFEALLQSLGTKRRSGRPARLLSLAPWTSTEVRRFVHEAMRSASDPEKQSLKTFLEALDDKGLHPLYADLPSHPLFLQFIMDDICSTGLHPRSQVELIRGWITRKIQRDIEHHGMPIDEPIDEYEFIGKMLLLTEAVAAAMTSIGATVLLAEYIDATRIEALAGVIFGRRIPLATLLLYGVMVPKAIRIGPRLEARFALRVLQEYFLARHVKRSGGGLEAYPESIRVLIKDLPEEVD
jgi:hypothetical protein